MSSIRWLAQNSAAGKAEDFSDGTTIIKTGFQDQDFNVVFLFKPPRSSTEIVRSVRHLFLDSKTNYEVVVTPRAKEATIPIIRELDLGLLRKVPGMLLDDLPDSLRELPDNFEIRRVKDLDELSIFFKTMSAGFGSSPYSFDLFIKEMRQRSINIHKLHAEDGLSFYVGYFLGKPVSTSVRFTSDHIAGIYGVSTIGEFRRMGIGEAMVWRALFDGKLEEDCTMSFLQASEMGRPVYEKMGYHVISEYEEWVAK